MMNIFALSLVLTTLLTASVHSPNPVKNKDVIVKEGHRVVMVEYDEEGEGNTKVSISKSDQANGNFVKSVTDTFSGLSGLVGGPKEKLKEDAELAKDVASKSKSLFWGAAETAKDSVSNKAKQASDMAGDVKSRIEGGAKGAAAMTKQGMKETGEMARRGKEAVGDAVETTKTLKGYVTNKIKHVWQTTRHFGLGLWHAMFDNVRLYMSVLQLFGFATAYGMAVWVTFVSNYLVARALPRQQFANMQSKIYPFYFKAMAYSVGLALLGHILSLLSEGRIRLFVSLRNFPGLNLLSSLGMIVANMLYFEPRTSKVMFDRLKWEEEESRGVQDADATTARVTKSSEVSEASPTKGTSQVSPTKGTTKVTTETTATAPPLVESASESNPLKIIELSESLKKLHYCSSLLNVLTLMGLTLHLVHIGLCLGTC